ncbi:MAG TPA: cystathionine beta-synthase [Candidatus Dormibacteraeota bacterium]|jgi:cystathionine beta-synthase|nr:cystathionine beta-synthase [Candidatus Dormibacteraeota bacterium]
MVAVQVLGSILEAVGHTPLVRLQHITAGVRPTILAKLETLNPGGSVKDRIGLRMIEEAERQGLLKPGGTIVEPTSGNTGHALAIAAALKGYRMIFVMADKQSPEKIALLRAYGAEVVVCPTAVPRESPESYYSVAERLSHEIPGAYQPNQYFNQANPRAHYETTGPEIYEQTDGTVDVVVAGLGTGGTMTGVARFLREKKPSVMIVGADPEGSLYSGDAIKPYKVEGIGEDFIPGTIDLKLIDRIVRVSDRESFLMARRITREEGILVGGSAGTAMTAALEVARDLDASKLIVVILSDTGRNNMSKIYNDEWMRQNGFLERFPRQLVHDVVVSREREMPELITVSSQEKVGRAIDLLQEYGISQMPVTEDGSGASRRLVGSIQERTLLDRVYRDPGLIETTVGAAMDGPFPTITAGAHVDEAFSALLGGATALIVMDAERPVGIITRLDLLEFMAHTRASR